jgi:chemotaxis protein histidine kinase CheA
MTNEDDKIKVYKRRNILKNKLGTGVLTNEEGHLDQEKIDEADKLIADLCVNCLETMGEHLDNLSSIWSEMQEIPLSAEREEKAQQIFTLAHEIKDISALCGYSLVAYFAESLRDYIAETTYELKNQRVIIQAHIDALNVIQKNNIKDETSPAAEELKKMVKVAIDKYK